MRQQIAAAAQLLAADPAQAEKAARALLAAAPADPSVKLILASALRRQGDAGAALTVLEPLAQAYPRAAMTHYELGLTRAALGDDGGAIAALTQAVSVKPQIPEAWEALGQAHFRRGDGAAMDAAFAQQLRHSLREPRLVAAAEAMAAARAQDAERLLGDHLAARPDDADALKMLGDVLNGLERHGEAEAALARALVLAPDFDGARFSYATALFLQQKTPQAIAELRRLLIRDPANPAWRNLMASALALAGEFDEALALQSALVVEYPNQPKLWLNHANTLKTVGRADAAVAAFRRAIHLAPRMGAAYGGLANAKVMRFTADEIAVMRALLADPALPDADRLDVEFALGKALEDEKDHAGAFSHYAASAALRRARVAWPADAFTARVEKSERVLTAEFFAARSGAGDPAPDPIFIVGLPRSGSTLVEQILASHPDVEGTMELPDLGRAAAMLAAAHGAQDWLDVIEQASPAELAAAGGAYLDSTRFQRRTARPLFVDKMPNNFLHAGLIALILPHAKVIDARRAPMAACFSAFKQSFAQGQAFSYDLGDLGRYYRDYVRLMRHIDRVLPGRVHRIVYEEMVDDSEGQIRRLLDACGLSFDPACLRFWETQRAVRTVSSEQVRQPIYRSGLEHWKAYEPWLDDLKAALGPALEDWRA